jgi:uncharacterized protein YoxC
MNTSITKALGDLKTSVDNITNDSAAELTRVTAELNDLKTKIASGELDNEQIAAEIEGHVTTISAVSDALKQFEAATAPVSEAAATTGEPTAPAESSLSTSAPHSSTFTQPVSVEDTGNVGETTSNISTVDEP